MSKHALFQNEMLKLMHERGFKGATMRLLAEKLECDVANIYNYIDSKQHSLDRYLFELSNQFHQGIDHIRQSNLSSMEKLKQVIHMYVRMSAEKPYQMSLLVNEWRHLRAERQGLFLKERKAYERKVRSLLKEGISDGTFKALDPNVATHLVLSSTRWLFNYFTSGKKVVNPIELERQIALFVESGISNSRA